MPVGCQEQLPHLKQIIIIKAGFPCCTPGRRERAQGWGAAGGPVQLEALHALYNICKFNKVLAQRGFKGAGKVFFSWRPSMRCTTFFVLHIF
jgi:hypothetical protein